MTSAPRLAQGAEQLREAQVVADRAADGPAGARVGHDVRAARDEVALAHLRAVGQVHVEQVHLAVAGDLGAVGSEHGRGVVDRPVPALGDAAAVQGDPVLLRHLPHGPVGGAVGERLGAGVQRLALVREEGPVLGQHHEIGPLLGGFGDQLARGRDVRGLVGAGVHLDEGDSHRVRSPRRGNACRLVAGGARIQLEDFRCDTRRSHAAVRPGGGTRRAGPTPTRDRRRGSTGAPPRAPAPRPRPPPSCPGRSGTARGCVWA